MLIDLLKMLISHILGDFVFQPKSWVEKRKTNIQYLFYHVAVHAGLLILFFINDLDNKWQSILFLVAAHLAIDSLKIGWEQKWPSNPVRIFLVDQALHIASIFAVYYFNNMAAFQDILTNMNWNHVLLYTIAILLIVFVIPIVIRVFFSKWNKEVEFNSKRKETLFDAGTIIGILERAMILGFVLLGLNEGIGFLLAAKSIFRFGDLTNAKDTKFTEYVLIGTLLSFGLGMLVAFGLKYLLTIV